jgi:proline dehydrogenase
MTVQLPVQETTQQNDNVAPTAGSTARSIVDIIPLKLVLWLASPYLAGETHNSAIDKAHELYRKNRFTGTIDILGEDCTSEADCDQFVGAYKATIDAVAARPLVVQRPADQLTVSMKPSMFSPIVPTDSRADRNAVLARAYDRILEVVAYAKQRGINMTLEAEDHRWADFHLDTYFSLLKAGYTNLGTVLQSRLFRTKDDLKRFDESARVRMVIGIYNEPANLALTEKPKMKQVLVDYAAELAARGTYLEVATHDSSCVDSFVQRVAVPQRLPADRWETQFLLGVPRLELQQSLVSGKYFADLANSGDPTYSSAKAVEYLSDMARTGVPVRMYLPFGKDAVAAPYCKRRLKANPNIMLYGIKNALHLK